MLHTIVFPLPHRPHIPAPSNLGRGTIGGAYAPTHTLYPYSLYYHTLYVWEGGCLRIEYRISPTPPVPLWPSAARRIASLAHYFQ